MKFWMNKDFLDQVSNVLVGRTGGFSYCPYTGTALDLSGTPQDIVTLASINIPRFEITPGHIEAYLAPFEPIFKKTVLYRLCVGAYMMGDKESVSIDINVIVHQSSRANSMIFAHRNNQQAIWDCKRSSSVILDGDGNTILKTPEQVAAAAEALSFGREFPFEAPKAFRWRKSAEAASSYEYVDASGVVVGQCNHCFRVTAFGDVWWSTANGGGRCKNIAEAKHLIEKSCEEIPAH